MTNQLEHKGHVYRKSVLDSETISTAMLLPIGYSETTCVELNDRSSLIG
jgi:hypothetical protein